MKAGWIAFTSIFLTFHIYSMKYTIHHPPQEDIPYKTESFALAHFFSIFIDHGGDDAREHAK